MGGRLELDGFSEFPSILCEAWAHIGPPRPAQKNKPMVDSIKLQYVSSLFNMQGKCILLFGDREAASHYQGQSWMAQYLKKQNIVIKIIEFPPQIREKILKAQKRQRR